MTNDLAALQNKNLLRVETETQHQGMNCYTAAKASGMEPFPPIKNYQRQEEFGAGFSGFSHFVSEGKANGFL